MAAAYEKQGVLFVGINSNKTEPSDGGPAHAKEHGHTFPIAKDPDNKVADLYDAKRTPEVFVMTRRASSSTTAGSTRTTRTRRRSPSRT